MKKYIFIIIIVVILGVISLSMKNNENMERESTIKYVSMNEIAQIMNENQDYIILDVRTIEEYSEGHIPNAICIPNETINEDVVDKLPNKEQLILIYCRSGNRSKQAANKLQELGYANLIEFGGIQELGYANLIEFGGIIDWKGEIVK